MESNELDVITAELVNDIDVRSLALSTGTDIDLSPVMNMEFAVIGKNEMSEISEFISTTHSRMLNNFSKSQSNWMDSLLVFNAGTDVRNLRQISAEIEKKKMALVESQFNMRKKDIELRMKYEEFEDDTKTHLEKEMIGIEIEEMIHARNQGRSYIEAALKTILCMKQQFETIMENKGIESITELDFEKEEEEYHIKKACHQAFEDIVASGRVSVGNNRFLLQIGIMPNLVHDFWVKFLATKDSFNKQNFLNALEFIYQQTKGCSTEEIKRRGMDKEFYENSVLQIEK